MMKELINKEFKGELIVISARPSLGQTTLLYSLTKQLLKDNKKVLFISLDTGKDTIIKRFQSLKDIPNLQIEDTPIRELPVLENIINNFNGDLIAIDYLQLLPNHKQAIKLLKELSSSKDIPIVVTSSLSREYVDKDLSSLPLSEFKDIEYLTSTSDTFVLLYPKNEQEARIRILKSKNNREDIFDVLDILRKEEGI